MSEDPGFIMHYIAAEPTGPIITRPGGKGAFQVGSHGRYRIACDEKIQQDRFHRGTGNIGPVTCPKCMATSWYNAALEIEKQQGPEGQGPVKAGDCNC